MQAWDPPGKVGTARAGEGARSLPQPDLSWGSVSQPLSGSSHPRFGTLPLRELSASLHWAVAFDLGHVLFSVLLLGPRLSCLGILLALIPSS